MYRYAYLCVCVCVYIYICVNVNKPCQAHTASFILCVLDGGLYGMTFLGTERVFKPIWIYTCMVLHVYTKHADRGWA